jgi:predicted regulator of Ras-like GTPase activity (Roadblock/LC7/MglB family)
VFRLILDELLVTTPGALAAIFLDWEGETVSLACDRDLSDHSLRILGAYQGIFLTQLRAICAHTGAGEPRRFKIEFAGSSVLNYSVNESYYLVMLVDHDSNEGIAWRRLEKCRQKLLSEM